MTLVHLSARTFFDQFSRFDEKVKSRSGESFRSFRDGLPAEAEGYKEEIRKEALTQLAFGKWKRADVGKGSILERVIHAIELPNAPYKLKNNLVSWQARWGPRSQRHRSLLDARSNASARADLEAWFFEFFHDRVPEAEAFERFTELAGNSYDLVAYLFFLKDWNRFMPIAPSTFDKAFKLLGIELVTTLRCSWQNYVDYNDALRGVQYALRDVAGVTDARLVDAHSFCWMLARPGLPPSPPEVSVRPPVLLSIPQPITPQRGSSAIDNDEFPVVSEEQFAQRDAAQRRLGRLAQAIALRSEQMRLRESGYPDPETAVKPVWDEPGRGYDILSCEIDGMARHIEVKAARRSGTRLSFFVSRNEWNQSRSLPNYRFYLVLDVQSMTPTVLDVAAEDFGEECLTAETFIASFRGPRGAPQGESPD